MKLNRKWILVIALVVSMATAISGTLAYLTSTDTAKNTFTVGNVSIDLEEPSWDTTKTPTLLPGVEIAKDPQIKNIGSTKAWVWMEITVPTDLMSYIDWNTNDWTKTETTSGNNTVVTLKRATLLPAGETTATAFTKVALPASLTSMPESLGTGNVDIIVNAYAIQDANFADVDAAIKAYGTNGEGGDSGNDGEGEEGTATVTNDAELAAALAGDATNILMKSGNYGVIDVTKVNRSLTIAAADGTGVTIAGINGQNNNLSANITIKDVAIDNSKQTEGWYTGTSQNMKPCVGVWGGNYTFENCTFNVTGASTAETGVMSWWTTEKGVMTFTDCTFNGGNNSARAMQIYGNYDLNVNGCTFNTKKDYSIKYVGQAGTTACFKNNTVKATTKFVQTGSATYPGSGYSLVFENNTLADDINHVFVDNYESQTITINNVNQTVHAGDTY